MDLPVYWSLLLAAAVLAAAARLSNRRPLLDAFATPLAPAWLAAGALAAVALVFHCLAMFFGPWVDAIPFARGPAAAVRAMGVASQLAYWIPAVVAVVALRRMWWPALLPLITTLLGVGLTMYGPYDLSTHLGWLAAAVVVTLVVATAFVRPGRSAGSTVDSAASA